MVAAVNVRKVESKDDLDTFLTFPWTLYKDDPYWVPPLVSMQRDKLDRQKNPTWKHMEGDYFIAWRGNRPVGTIAAFINYRHNEFRGEHIGFFGFFEVYNDQEAANVLLETAAEYVRAKGYDAIRGPASFSTNDECGMLIEGFDDPPVVLMPYNYPYYPRLMERAPGFGKVMDVVSYLFTLQGFTNSEKIEQARRVTHKNNERRHITVRRFNLKQAKQEFLALREIYNNAWDDNWGFIPMSEDELDAVVKDLGRFLDPRLGFFAEIDGKPAAFLLAFPDLNGPLRRTYPRPGKPEVLSLLQLLWHWKIRSKVTRIRIPLLGVRSEYRGIGVEAAMFSDLLGTLVQLSAETGWQSADGGWVLETNQPMHRIVEALNARVYKRYRFYERSLI